MRGISVWTITPGRQACMTPGMSTTTAALARWWTSRGGKATRPWTTRFRSWSIWSTGRARMPRAKPATAWASWCRSATNSFRRLPPLWESPWAANGSTVWVCSSSPRRSCPGTRRKSYSKSSARRKDCPSWAGGRCPCARRCWVTRPEAVCPASGRPSWASRPG